MYFVLQGGLAYVKTFVSSYLECVHVCRSMVISPILYKTIAQQLVPVLHYLVNIQGVRNPL